MAGELKIDIINRAYSKLRISGITKIPSPEDISLALNTLENMMHEYFAREVCLDYNFEDNPDVNSLHNMPQKYWDAVSSVLAVRLIPDFGKGFNVDQALIRQSGSASSFLFSQTANVNRVQYPNRMPIGSGNRYKRYDYQQFYTDPEEAPNSCATNKMIIGDINDYVESFEQYLNDGEDVASYTLTADGGLTVVSQSLSTPNVNYRIKAETVQVNQKVVIVATTSDSRVETRIIYFELTDAEDY